MNRQLYKLNTSYQQKVAEANSLLKTELETDEPQCWQQKYSQVGNLGSGCRYRFHGIGCTVEFNGSEEVDFDYGPGGRIDGFDLWRLKRFLENRKPEFAEITETQLETWFESAIKDNEIVKLHSGEPDDLYYFAQHT